MQYLLPVYLVWFFMGERFAFVFQKLLLSTLIYVVIMMFSLWILLSSIQDGKTVRGSEIFYIKSRQNHTFKSLFEVFLESQGKKYFVFIILSKNRNSVCLNHSIRRGSSIQ